MQFYSFDFLLFFPVVILTYFIFPAKFRYVWLLAASYYFYISWNPLYVFLLISVTLLTWFCGLALREYKYKKVILVSGLVLLIGLLAYFKYADFALTVVNQLLAFLGLPLWKAEFDIMLPVGLSFFIFQTIGYLVDIYRGHVKAEPNLAKYALFVAFFPQILSGPIGRSGSLLAQLNNNLSVFCCYSVLTGPSTRKIKRLICC